MPDNNLKQARLPQGAEVIENPLGTAPGYRLDLPQGVAVVLPGVPREMRPMLDDGLIPWLASRCGGEGSRVARSFQIFGMSESALDAALAGLTEAEGEGLAFRAGVPNISVRLSVTGGEQEAAERLDQLAAELKSRLGAAVYAEGETDMETVVGELARSKGVTLATAESCTGGLIGQRVTAVAGSSDYYMGGLVAYSDDVKKKVLGVEGSTLAMFGAVSEETATEMALGVRRLTGSDVGLAVTGIAGPTGGSEEKPVGTVVVALAADGLDDGAVSRSYRLWGDREGVRLLASQVALDWVRRHLLGLKADQSALGLRGRGRA
jgi:nicotinamide-nucleotide amidase